MAFFENFPTKSQEEVCQILNSTGHQKVFDEISKTESGYIITKSLAELSALPTYRFAVACTIASLGNHPLANSICPSPERFVEPNWGDNISRDLASQFMAKQV